MSTEPTPDTPESELTGDGLRAALEAYRDAYLRVHSAYDGECEHGFGPPATQCPDANCPDRRLREAWDTLAALPNREAAPEPTGCDRHAPGTTCACRIHTSPFDCLPNREAAPSNPDEAAMTAFYTSAASPDEVASGRVRLWSDLTDAERGHWRALAPNREAAPREGTLLVAGPTIQEDICAAASPYGGVCVKRPDHVAGGSDHWDGEAHSWSVS